MIGDEFLAADHVRYLSYLDDFSDIDFLGDLDRIIDLDAEISNGALDLRMSEQKLHGSEVACPPVNQHSLRAA